MAYRYVQGLDYGPRKGTLGISLHMSEGFDGLPNFLAQHSGETRSEWVSRVSGVSCHVAILSTGEIVQMLGWDRACGNLNPADRAGEYGYYGGSYLRAVLGEHWPDPNAWTVSAELAGFRATGPTQAQVQATIKWGLEMRARFPTIRGATGHHDQSPKACPGTTPAIKAIFEGLGGHGLFAGDDVKFIQLPLPDAKPQNLRLPAGTQLYGLDGSLVVKTSGTAGTTRDWPLEGTADGHAGTWVIRVPTKAVYPSGATIPTLLVARTGTLIDAPVVVPPPEDCADEVVAAIAADRAKAKVTWM